MPMYFIDEFCHVLRARELGNTVAQVENMARKIPEAAHEKS